MKDEAMSKMTLEQIKALDATARDAMQQYKNARELYALQECPFNVGDEITNHYTPTSFGKRCVITRVKAASASMFGLDWVAVADVVGENCEVEICSHSYAKAFRMNNSAVLSRL